MKTKIIVSIYFLGSFYAYSQVGIGTFNPEQMLHIDAKKDNDRNDLTPEIKKSNDIFITEEAKVGIGYSDFVPLSRFEAKLTIESGEILKSGLKFTNLNSTLPNNEGETLLLGVTATTAEDGIDFPVGSVVPVANCIPEYYSASIFSSGSAMVINPAYPYYNQPHANVENHKITYNSSTSTRINLTINGRNLTDKLSSLPTLKTGTFTLKAGNTYRLEASIYNSGLICDNCSGFLEYEWVTYNPDNNTSIRIPSQGYNYNNNVGSTGGIQPLAIAYYSPTVDTLVALKSLSATAGLWPTHSYFLLQQMNPCN